MKKNVAGQVVGAQMVSASDGSAYTGTVTVYVTGDAGTQAIGSVGSGVCTHEGNGFHTYAPSQAETNYDHVAFTFIGTGAVPATVQIYTTYPQTGDSYARLGAPAGASVSADILAIDNLVDDLESRLGVPSDLGSGATIAANLVDIEAQTDDIGVAGAGLTALGDTRLANLDATVSSRATPAQVNAEVVDALNVDTYAEPGQVAPPATASLAAKIGLLAKLARNKVTQDATTLKIYADDGTTVDHKATVSDDGTTYTRGELTAGP